MGAGELSNIQTKLDGLRSEKAQLQNELTEALASTATLGKDKATQLERLLEVKV